MAVHSAGTGSGWLETLDVDQPSGLDYREFNDLRIGIRKRIAKEHATLADATVGGEHLPGGCGILLRDTTAHFDATTQPNCVDAIALCTSANTTDGTIAALWYFDDNTAAQAIKFSRGSFCTGADYSWGGNWQFDNTVFFKDNVEFSGDVLVDGTLTASQAEFSSTTIDGSCDISQTLHCYSKAEFVNDVTCNAGLTVDGTSTFNGKMIYKATDMSKQIITAWALVDGSAGTVIAGNGVTTKRVAAGDYSAVWTSAFTDASTYAVVLTGCNLHGTSYGAVMSFCTQLSTGIHMFNWSLAATAQADVSRFTIYAVGY